VSYWQRQEPGRTILVTIPSGHEKELRMSKSLPVSSSEEPERSEECTGENNLGKPYEPPRIERLGNLRELLAKTGAAPDSPGPHPRRT
jgi:hypothetical protein